MQLKESDLVPKFNRDCQGTLFRYFLEEESSQLDGIDSNGMGTSAKIPISFTDRSFSPKTIFVEPALDYGEYRVKFISFENAT